MVSVPAPRFDQYMARSTIIFFDASVDLTITAAPALLILSAMLYVLRLRAGTVSVKTVFPVPLGDM